MWALSNAKKVNLGEEDGGGEEPRQAMDACRGSTSRDVQGSVQPSPPGLANGLGQLIPGNSCIFKVSPAAKLRKAGRKSESGSVWLISGLTSTTPFAIQAIAAWKV